MDRITNKFEIGNQNEYSNILKLLNKKMFSMKKKKKRIN